MSFATRYFVRHFMGVWAYLSRALFCAVWINSAVVFAQQPLSDWQILAKAFSMEYEKENETFYDDMYALTPEEAKRIGGWGAAFQQKIQWHYSTDRLTKIVPDVPESEFARRLLEQWPQLMSLSAITRTEEMWGIGSLCPAAESYLGTHRNETAKLQFSLQDALAGLADVRVIEQDQYGRVEERGMTIVEELAGAAQLALYSHIYNNVASKLAQDGTRELAHSLRGVMSAIWQGVQTEMLGSPFSETALGTNFVIQATCAQTHTNTRFYIKNISGETLSDIAIVLDSTRRDGRGSATQGLYVKCWEANETITFIMRSDVIDSLSPQPNRRPTSLNLVIAESSGILLAGNLVQRPGSRIRIDEPEMLLVCLEPNFQLVSAAKIRSDVRAQVMTHNQYLKTATKSIGKVLAEFNRKKKSLDAEVTAALELDTKNFKSHLSPRYFHAQTRSQVATSRAQLIASIRQGKLVADKRKFAPLAQSLTELCDIVEKSPELAAIQLPESFERPGDESTVPCKVPQLHRDFVYAVESQLQRVEKLTLTRARRNPSADTESEALEEIARLRTEGVFPDWCAEKELATLKKAYDRLTTAIEEIQQASDVHSEDVDSIRDAEESIQREFGLLLSHLGSV